MNDLVSRQWLLDEYDRQHEGPPGKARTLIENAPTIEPMRKKGKWRIAYLDHEAMGERPSLLYCSMCSQCIAYPVNYCPNCGSYNGGDNSD